MSWFLVGLLPPRVRADVGRTLASNSQMGLIEKGRSASKDLFLEGH